MRKIFIAAVPMVSFAGCTPHEHKTAQTWPAATCAPVVAEDLDPSPNVLEVDLTAGDAMWSTGAVSIHGHAYNASMPGPLLEVTAGDVIKIHFHNELEMDTTVHWHGMRVPGDQDGVPIMQNPVPPGRSWEYEFVAADPGFYWYHPHMDSDRMIDKGLYGLIVVRDPAEPAVTCDAALALDDLPIDEDGKFIEDSGVFGHLNGNLGSHLIANGREDRTLPIAPGGFALLRLVNTANARAFDLELEGHTMTVVASDGGYLAQPFETQRLLMVPGERFTVLIHGTAGVAGGAYRFLNYAHEIHHDGVDPMGAGPNPVLTLVYGGTPVTETKPVFPAAPMPVWSIGPPYTIAHVWELAQVDNQLTIDGAVWPDVPVVTVPGNADTVFQVNNTAMGSHPFHLHGNRFEVIALDGVPPPYRGWKDTVDIPPSTLLTFVSRVDNPGRWMLHCHILEHAEDGMMAELDVLP